MKHINTSGKIAVILYAYLKDNGFAGDLPSPTDLGNHSTWKMPIKKFIKECLLIFKIVGMKS